MGLTYFRRYRMSCDLATCLVDPLPLPSGYAMVPFADQSIRQHAEVKYESFRDGLDTFVFHSLARRDGCLRLMREIAGRQGFAPEATWLCRYGAETAVGTIQGLQIEGVGSIQNLGIHPDHRSRQLGTILLYHAAVGFRSLGVPKMQLEVTCDNTAAVRLYRRLGMKIDDVVYKTVDVNGVGIG